MSKTRPLVFALAATTLIAGGCGSSKSNSTNSTNSAATRASTQPVVTTPLRLPAGPAPGTSRLSRAALIARANAICRQLNRSVITVHTTSLESVGTTAPTLAGYYRTALGGLGKLAPPASMTSDWKAILTGIALAEREILVMGRYALANDMASTVRVETGIEPIQMHRFAIAKRNGLKDCAEI